MKIETVLCPIDFSTLSDYELRLAVEACETFGARLVLHHNLSAVGPGFAKAWEWEKAHHDVDARPEEVSEPEARRHMSEILTRLPATVEAEARISRGPIGIVLFYMIDEVDADLVILGSHGWSSEEHASVSEAVLESAPCPVLTFQEGRGEDRSFRLHAVEGEPAPHALVLTDFSDSAAAATAYAFDLARRTPLELHLLHVEPSRKPQAVPVDHTTETGGSRESATEAARQRLAEMVPADLEGRVSCEVAVGPVGDEILAAARRHDAELLVMGTHASSFFRHYFTHDTARELLHRARCPVLYVPASSAA